MFNDRRDNSFGIPPWLIAYLFVIALIMSLIQMCTPIECGPNVTWTLTDYSPSNGHTMAAGHPATVAIGCLEAGLRAQITVSYNEDGRFTGGEWDTRGANLTILSQSSSTHQSTIHVESAGDCRPQRLHAPVFVRKAASDGMMIEKSGECPRKSITVMPVRVRFAEHRAGNHFVYGPNVPTDPEDPDKQLTEGGLPFPDKIIRLFWSDGAKRARDFLSATANAASDIQWYSAKRLVKRHKKIPATHLFRWHATDRFLLGGEPSANSVVDFRVRGVSRYCPSRAFVPECSDDLQLIVLSAQVFEDFNNWVASNMQSPDWLNDLPATPDRVCVAGLDNQTYRRDMLLAGWNLPEENFTHYHPEGVYETRSVATVSGYVPAQGGLVPVYHRHGHQAIYDHAGELIRVATAGYPKISAGSADRVSPRSFLQVKGHVRNDVQPWLQASWLDGNATHAFGQVAIVIDTFDPFHDKKGLAGKLLTPIRREGMFFDNYISVRPDIAPGGIVHFDCANYD